FRCCLSPLVDLRLCCRLPKYLLGLCLSCLSERKGHRECEEKMMIHNGSPTGLSLAPSASANSSQTFSFRGSHFTTWL
ncbi:hypothetical protein BSL78_24096, partial [Apostichopus japonicus]